MRKLTWLGWMALAAWMPLAGCGDDGESNDPPPGDVDNNDTNNANNNPPVELTSNPRMIGQRAPATAPCDGADTTRCALPWPSDTFAVADTDSPTGLRIQVDPSSLPEIDDPSPLGRATGFSRVSPIVTAFATDIDPNSAGQGVEAAVQLIVTEDGPQLGQKIPVRVEVFVETNADGSESAIVAYPQVPLAPSTEYTAIVTTALQSTDGASVQATDHTRVALAQQDPKTQDEQDLADQHNPARLALQAAGVDPTEVARVWSFTTRDQRRPIEPLMALRQQVIDAVENDDIGIEVDRMEINPRDSIAVIVQGRLTGMPRFLGDNNTFTFDDAGAPTRVGQREAAFRVVVPAGEGDYRLIMYGHGTGGDVSDSAFDDLITESGAAKVGIQFDGWTEAGLLTNAQNFRRGIPGAESIASELAENLVMGIGIQYALGGVLGDFLAAPTIDGQDNPAVGRRPDPSDTVWAGGSLGGSMGMLYSNVEPTIQAAVINVPGAGFTHYLRFSNLYSVLILIFESAYDTNVDIELAIAMSQTMLDVVDGAVWADAIDNPPVFLIQQSIGDPVMPNIGTDLVATSTGALHIGEVLRPITGLELATEAVGTTAITQYKVSDESALDIHGFAAKDSPAGNAARQQIDAFIQSVWDGAPLIRVPASCAGGNCDFTE